MRPKSFEACGIYQAQEPGVVLALLYVLLLLFFLLLPPPPLPSSPKNIFGNATSLLRSFSESSRRGRHHRRRSHFFAPNKIRKPFSLQRVLLIDMREEEKREKGATHKGSRRR